jgi:hypothetical protein
LLLSADSRSSVLRSLLTQLTILEDCSGADNDSS